MPYKSEKIKLPPEKDRRRKLADDQKEQIKNKPTCDGIFAGKEFIICNNLNQ